MKLIYIGKLIVALDDDQTVREWIGDGEQTVLFDNVLDIYACSDDRYAIIRTDNSVLVRKPSDNTTEIVINRSNHITRQQLSYFSCKYDGSYTIKIAADNTIYQIVIKETDPSPIITSHTFSNNIQTYKHGTYADVIITDKIFLIWSDDLQVIELNSDNCYIIDDNKSVSFTRSCVSNVILCRDIMCMLISNKVFCLNICSHRKYGRNRNFYFNNVSNDSVTNVINTEKNIIMLTSTGKCWTLDPSCYDYSGFTSIPLKIDSYVLNIQCDEHIALIQSSDSLVIIVFYRNETWIDVYPSVLDSKITNIHSSIDRNIMYVKTEDGLMYKGGIYGIPFFSGLSLVENF